jgi:hypothetical protein
MEDIVEKVTPSGVPFSVRNLIGEDQDMLTKAIKSTGETTAFNQMMTNALRKLGNLEGDQIKPKVVSSMLSNDRAFVLLTMRQHTLSYKPNFDFKYEWPLQVGKRDKEVVDYSVDLNHENFPVIPYAWMRKKIAELQKEDPAFKPDGHLIPFPVIYQDYSQMVSENKNVEGEFPISKKKYKWEVLDGLTEANYAKALREDIRINLMLEMRKPKYLFADGVKKDVWAEFETKTAHILDLEHLRDQIRDIEGLVDTTLTIQHPTDVTRRERVNLISLPVFFFPSLAR